MRTEPKVAIAFLVTLAACATGSESATPAEESAVGGAADGHGGAGGGGANAPAAIIPCSALDACPPGMGCVLGVCEKGCNADEDCNAGQVCVLDGQQLCHGKAVSNCPETPCLSTQACINGLCGLRMSEFCGPSPFTPSDGCDADSVCLLDAVVDGDVVMGAKCYSFALCPESGECPVGDFGAVCNDGIFPEKNRICLGGICTSSENCPENRTCVPAFEGSLHGTCWK
jgi:hypothetical protein